MRVMEVEQIKNLPATYKALAGVLREGKAEAITSSDILRLTGLKDKRQVSEIIEQLVVRHGHVIGSNRTGDHKGYYYISDKTELLETLETYNNQIQSMLKRHIKLQENYIKRERGE